MALQKGGPVARKVRGGHYLMFLAISKKAIVLVGATF